MEAYLQGLTMGLAYVAPIGLQNLFVINTALTQKRSRAYLTALIVIFFDVTLAFACFFGIGAIMQRFEWLRMAVLLVGSGIVIWIGIGLLRDRGPEDTAADVDLTNKAKERGVFRLSASAAVRKGVFKGAAGGMDIPIGSRFSGGTVNYRATKKESLGVYEMTCEDAGEIGNDYFGNLIPIDYP